MPRIAKVTHSQAMMPTTVRSSVRPRSEREKRNIFGRYATGVIVSLASGASAFGTNT